MHKALSSDQRGGRREGERGEARKQARWKRRRKPEEGPWSTEGSVCWGPSSGGDSDSQAAPGGWLTLSLSWSVLYLWVFLPNEGGMASGNRVLFGGEQKEGQREKIGSQRPRLPGAKPLGEKVQEDCFLEEPSLWLPSP